MFTRDIKCSACGFKGKIEAHDTIGKIPASQHFKILGKEPSTGMLHFECPSCHQDFAISPLTFISPRQIAAHDKPFSLLLFLGRIFSGSAVYFLWYHKATISAIIAAFVFYRKDSFILFSIAAILCLVQAYTHRLMNAIAEKYQVDGMDQASAVQLVPDNITGVNMISSISIGILFIVAVVKLL